MTDIKGARLQNALGRSEDMYRDDMKMSSLSVGKILKVHHKTGTADIILVNSNDEYSSSAVKEGRYSARMLQRSSFYDEKSKRYWGTYDPLAIGSLVLVAFMDGMKSRPVILGALNRPDNEKNINTTIYPLDEKKAGFQRREALKQLQIFPNLTYKKMDGEGNIERTFGNKSFLAIYNAASDFQDTLRDNHGGFDFQDLSENDKRTGETIESDWDESKSPMKLLYVHRDVDGKGWTKVFIDVDGTLRITRDADDGTLTYVEMDEPGNIKVRRQVDSPEHGQGNDYAETGINVEGTIYSERKKNNQKSTFSMRPNSVDYYTDGDVNITAKGDVNITGATINLNETGG